MRSRHLPISIDLIVTAASVLCIAVISLTSNVVIDVIAGLPLTVYLPGAALFSAIGPLRLHSQVVERQFWILGTSLGLTVIGGIVLNLAGGLTRTSWLVWFGAVVAVCFALRAVLSPRSVQFDVDSSTLPGDAINDVGSHESSFAEPKVPSEDQGSTKVSMRQVALLVSAGVICAAALMLSIHTNATTSRESFVQAWVLPLPANDVASTSVQLGLRNHLGVRRVFSVDVNVGNGPTKEFLVYLDDGATWTHVITRLPGERVESNVHVPWQPGVVLARAYLATPVA